MDSTRESRQSCSVLQWTNIIVISLCVHSPRLSSSRFCLYFETEITRSGIIDHGEDKLLVEQLNKVILVLINSGTCKFEC